MNTSKIFDILSALINADLGSCSIQDGQGRYPLHLLCGNKCADSESLTLLLQSYADASKTMDSKQIYPLGYLMGVIHQIDKDMASEMVLTLIDSYPDACKGFLSNRQLPLHVYLFEKGFKSKEVIAKLLEYCPEAIFELDKHNQLCSG